MEVNRLSASQPDHFTPRERAPVSIKWRQGKPQSWSGYSQEKNVLSLLKTEPKLLSYPASNLATIPSTVW